MGKLPRRLQQMLARAKATPFGYTDVDRICALPFSEPMEYQCEQWRSEAPHRSRCPYHDLEACPGTEADAWSYSHVLAEAYDNGFRLWEPQCRGLRDWMQEGGLLGPIGVGWGKSLLLELILEHDWVNRISNRSLMLVPSEVYAQTMNYNLPFARNHIPFSVPIIGLGGLSPKKRRALVHRMKPGAYIMPHSLLSTRDTEETLAQLDPDTVLVDECHDLVNLHSARGDRFAKFCKARKRRYGFVSGTITKKRVAEYASFLKWALGEGSCLPLSQRMCGDWGAVLDSDAPRIAVSTGPLEPLRTWARVFFPEEHAKDPISNDQHGTRRAYKLRLNSTPGVVATGDMDIGVGLRIVNAPCEEPLSGRMIELLDDLEDRGLTPNGDEIEYPLHLYKWRFELYTSGGYNEQVWPEAEVVASRWGVPLVVAERRLELARGAHDEHNRYARELRGFIDDTRERGLDTPMLVGAHCKRFREGHGVLHVPHDLYLLWEKQYEARQEATDDYGRIVERDRRYVRVQESRPRHAADFARVLQRRSKRSGDNGSVIVWAYSRGLAEWIYELLWREDEKNVLYCPAGGQNNELIRERQNDGLIVVASITGHGKGKNLQGYGQTLLAQTVRPAHTLEQLLGRNHRGGQKRDELVVHQMLSSPFEHDSFCATLIDALYIQQTTGARQKIVMAGYDPMPVIVPPGVLRERSVPDARILDRRMARTFKDRFAI